MSKPILEANAVVPLYRQLMEKLQKEITSGILKPGDRLLPEVEMAKYYQVQGFSESCLARGLKPGARLLQKEIVAPKSSILESLGLDENSQTVKIVRLRYVNDEPMVIETSYFPLDYAFLLQENLDGSLFQVLREKKDLVIDGSKKIVEICRATTEEARWLKLRKNAPLLLVRSVAFGNAGQPVYVCMQVINGERFQLIL